jgi:hypothetical protein
MLWPGGLSGVTVLDGQTQRFSFRVASDHLGGAAVVATQLVSGSNSRTETRAGRVLANGSVPWTAAGKPVVSEPAYSVAAQALAMDAQGRSFAALELYSLSGAPNRFVTQLLGTQGGRMWGILGTGIDMGVSNGPISGLATPFGFVSLHVNAEGIPLYQQQDESGSAIWGDGIPADWTMPASAQWPVATSEGHVMSVWQSLEGPPNSGIRALELDEGGNVAPGWPVAGTAVCGALAGHFISDAMISGGNLFVAFGSGEGSGVLPAVQRLSRAVLAAPTDLPAQPLELSPPALGSRAWRCTRPARCRSRRSTSPGAEYSRRTSGCSRRDVTRSTCPGARRSCPASTACAFARVRQRRSACW